MKDEDRTPALFHQQLNEFLLAEIPNAPDSISLRTANRWMNYLGFFATAQSKGYFNDGHNRDDVVKYRDDVFLPRMVDYDRYA
jgi:hypothetical protein